MTSDASTRSSNGSGRPAISRNRWRARAGCVRTRPDSIRSTLRTLQRLHLAAKVLTDLDFRLRRPVEHDDHNFSSGSNLLAMGFADFVHEIERSGPHLTNPNADVDRLHPQLLMEITFRTGHDEINV